ncbi:EXCINUCLEASE ABC SUBUNIT A [Mycoplasmopsis pulmonis]|uniref:UvrABC system protein A n=1 Tax=Mycoplasmopsis pulmonis (strain UAB CTIP) TaxID=272635 RepID=UVRA_MYCPU|nr:excinuclease ABC subunit UvrA [Mycoplasmopsis pulmonis]Q98PL2.1 RecName: Full=UvrABC system protein A; Short=UvrA protein; AltName: Full=Excinuclease ABC subunit A [Mycoplasmopsis pulmonis UAB CTIP]CAC13883.1 EXCINUCLEASE ABC SUBUNIT A [Mycoplasmopsis pulmonis]VEU68476.1 ABC transporter ATPase [Mycoplasmopsis pulmonis]
MSKVDFLHIKGARENNLKNVELTIPKNKLVIFTGLSGSGKSSLAFNTIYEEGRRRYVDSLSSYARQFLGGTSKPDVDSIEGLSPAISIEQKTTHNNPRSTVGTVTEIYDYLRLLYARIGKPFCPKHKIKIEGKTTKLIIEGIVDFPKNSKLIILSPVVELEKGTHQKLIAKLKTEGFLRLKINNEIVSLSDDKEINLDKNKRHSIDIVVDRIVLNEEKKLEISEAISIALEYGKGIVKVENVETGEIKIFSSNHSCPKGDFEMPKIETRLFSFNSPYGMCQNCKGLGVQLRGDYNLLVPDQNLSISEGAIKIFESTVNSSNQEWQEFEALLNYYGIDKNIPMRKLSESDRQIIKYGSKEEIDYIIKSQSNKFKRTKRIEGIIDKVERKYLETSSEGIRTWIKRYMSEFICNMCKGSRLNEHALAVKINGLNIWEISSLSINDVYEQSINLNLSDYEREITTLLISELTSRLSFLVDVGLDYLTLNRMAESLSGGEAQRIRLATQIGSNLTGVLYVLDEPSIGLHQKDNERLIKTLRKMVEIGNTLIVVEHDEDTMRASDFIVDIGPKAGSHGGEIVALGSVEDIIKNPISITGKYLSGEWQNATPKSRRSGSGNVIKITGASQNNIKKLDFKIPLGKFIGVTGVSGSGKSTLINQVLVNAIEKGIARDFSHDKNKNYEKIEGLLYIDKLIKISQSPIGRTPRSNPATYSSLFDDIREIFSNVPEAKARGYQKGRFSFNVPGGRCEKCSGDGSIKIEMFFLPNVYITCDHCDGKRYNEETLQIKYRSKSISDVLDMTVSDALAFFENRLIVKNKLQTLEDVGLGYIKLGQSSTTLSGGEAQRVKLASHLLKKSTGKTLYVLDEPTTGLHSHDVSLLLKVLNRLVDKGDTVIVIEHNLDVIKNCDYLIDLGPGGGVNGGKIIATGTPEQVAQIEKSYTGEFLKRVL